MENKSKGFGGRLFGLLGALTKLFLLFAVVMAVTATWVIYNSGDSDYQPPGDVRVVNDITGLNPVRVGRVVQPDTLSGLVEALQSTDLPVSIGGGRFSQGGQTSYPASLHFDMRSFNKVLKLDVENKQVTVQAGIRWRDLQEHIDPYDLSVKIMQTYANFTVGGSLSVNVHGRYIGEGPLVKSVISMRMVLPDGSVVTVSPEENAEIFYAVIGGYGGLGVIAEATLQLVDNVKVEQRVATMPVEAYRAYFFSAIRNNTNVVFHNADLYPPAYENVRDVSWYLTNKPLTNEERLIPVDRDYRWQPGIAEFVADYDIGKILREYVVDPWFYRTERVVWRNHEASYDVRELEPASRQDDTYVLREYFVPVENFDTFVPEMRRIFQEHDVNVLNVSIRHALADPGTLLAWARSEVFAFVVYYRQGTSAQDRDATGRWSQAMIDAVIEAGGSYYLPYQVYATPEQFHAAYPRAEEYFALKQKLDPDNRFRNRLWEQYYAPNPDSWKQQQAQIAQYYRGEEQTFLTIPEWYLVFSPREYADYLEAGNNPSDFPFFASINEYWALYDRVVALTDGVYPGNSEYMTMLKVIGVSTTVEYLFKGAYEATVGRFTRWTADNEDVPEDVIIQQANRAYSDLIYTEAWYQFDFMSWVKRIWAETTLLGDNLLRKLERKFYFTAEYSFKAAYAALIEWAATTSYEPSDGLVYLTAIRPSDASTPPAAPAKTLYSEADRVLLSVPRWGPFTQTLPKLAAAGYRFVDVSGNSAIAISALGPASEGLVLDNARPLFISRVVSDEQLHREVWLVDVKHLHQALSDIRAQQFELEHIYDY